MSDPKASAQTARNLTARDLANSPNAIAPDSPDYPGYVLTFLAPGMNPSVAEVRGPHTDLFVSVNQDLTLKVEVAHSGTLDPVPNLTITITRP